MLSLGGGLLWTFLWGLILLIGTDNSSSLLDVLRLPFVKQVNMKICNEKQTHFKTNACYQCTPLLRVSGLDDRSSVICDVAIVTGFFGWKEK